MRQTWETEEYRHCHLILLAAFRHASLLAYCNEALLGVLVALVRLSASVWLVLLTCFQHSARKRKLPISALSISCSRQSPWECFSTCQIWSRHCCLYLCCFSYCRHSWSWTQSSSLLLACLRIQAWKRSHFLGRRSIASVFATTVTCQARRACSTSNCSSAVWRVLVTIGLETVLAAVSVFSFIKTFFWLI